MPLFTRFLQCVRQSSPAVQTFFQDVIEKASFLLESQTDDARVCKEESRLLSQTRSHSLLDTCTREDVHAYNVCVALLKRRQILRCCVLWVKYWGIDVVLVGSERWVEERKEVHRKAMAKCSEMTKRFLLFDACMMDCWKCLMGKSRVMAEVLAMESSSVLYPMCCVCCTLKECDYHYGNGESVIVNKEITTQRTTGEQSAPPP